MNGSTVKKYLIGAAVVAAAGFLMALPYLLREVSPSGQPVFESGEAPLKTEGQPETQGDVVRIEISDFKFIPATVTVKRGTPVQWANQDALVHTVTGDSGGPESSLLEQGTTYRYTFSQLGIFPYHCKPHPFMQGTVEVVE